MSGMATNDQTVAAYDQGVDLYNASLNRAVSGELKLWFERMLVDQPATASVLEIGSGTGRDATYLESLGCSVERTDASKGFVEYLQDNGYNARILNILTDDLEGSYDVVLANAVFLHFTEAECKRAAQKVLQVLKPGGCFALSLKQGEGEETTDAKVNAPRYFRYWKAEGIQQLLESVGFTDVEISVNDDWRADKPQWLLITARKGRS